MTVSEAIAYLDETTPNRYSRVNKTLWLQAVDTAVAAILGIERSGDGEELLLQSPYDNAYLRYMEAQVRYHDGYMDAYREAMAAYEAILQSFRACVRRRKLSPRGGRFL